VASQEGRDCFLREVGTTRSELAEIAGKYLSDRFSVGRVQSDQRAGPEGVLEVSCEVLYILECISGGKHGDLKA